MEGTTFSPRPATLDDLPAVLEIEKRSYPHGGWSSGNFEAELGKPYSHFLLLSDDETDQIVSAYIVFWLLNDECQILNVAVDLPYRGLGQAKQLLRKAASLALRQGIQKLTLDVRKGNLPAIHLYQGLGFAITHVRKSFYANGEDAYTMGLELKDNVIQF
jgi:[ribosomal protein S18]-alanine N-acetyltransferase